MFTLGRSRGRLALQLSTRRWAPRRYRSQQPEQLTSAKKLKPIASQTDGISQVDGSTVYSYDQHAPLKSFHLRKTKEHMFALHPSSSSSSATATTDHYSDDTAKGRGSRARKLLSSMEQKTMDYLSALFLPRDAKASVTSDYWPYAKWYFLGFTISSASGVLSMQSLLYAIGLGAGAIPTAAAINWVLKDGLGQFGGVLFASVVNNRYDADPKRWRIASAVALDASVLMEILTPLFPAYFLPMASIANVAKNISWLSASATRAGFHNNFAKKENLADVTAKAGSQAILASIVGTGLGIMISKFTGPETFYTLCAFSGLSFLHMFCVYRSMCCVSLRTLNLQRLHLVATDYLHSNGSSLQTPDDVSEREVFFRTMVHGYKSMYKHSLVSVDASLQQLAPTPARLLELKQYFRNEKYLLTVEFDAKHQMLAIPIALQEEASSGDLLRGHLHALLIQELIETECASSAEFPTKASPDKCWELVERAYAQMNSPWPHSNAMDGSIGKTFVQSLIKSPWTTDNILVEEKNARYKWLE